MSVTTDNPGTDPVKTRPAGFVPLSPRRKIGNSAAGVLVTLALLIALVPLFWLIITLVARGIEPILDPDWWFRAERYGGAANAIVGTLIQTALAAVISVPLGIFVAIYLVEYGKKNRLARAVTFLVDVMTGIPSIVAGLFAVALFFAGMSAKLNTRRMREAMLVLGCIVFLGALAWIATLPVSVSV